MQVLVNGWTMTQCLNCAFKEIVDGEATGVIDGEATYQLLQGSSHDRLVVFTHGLWDFHGTVSSSMKFKMCGCVELL